MINSLRLHGHDEPIFVLDCGLDAGAARAARAQATVVERRRRRAAMAAEDVAPLRHRAEVMVLIDADMIVTRPLAELIDPAAEGARRGIRERQPPLRRRMGRAARPRPGTAAALRLLGTGRVRAARPGTTFCACSTTASTGSTSSSPSPAETCPTIRFCYPEQDVLNAILCSDTDPRKIVTLEHRLAATPPFDGLRISAQRPPQCTYPTARCRSCSTTSIRKPWLQRMRSNVYSRLLTGLLLGDDLPLRIAASELPPRLRSGPAAAAERLGTDLILGAPGIARRLRERRSARGELARTRSSREPKPEDHGRGDRLDRACLPGLRAGRRASRPRARGHRRELRTLARRRRGTRDRLHRSRGADGSSRGSPAPMPQPPWPTRFAGSSRRSLGCAPTSSSATCSRSPRARRRGRRGAPGDPDPAPLSRPRAGRCRSTRSGWRPPRTAIGRARPGARSGPSAGTRLPNTRLRARPGLDRRVRAELGLGRSGRLRRPDQRAAGAGRDVPAARVSASLAGARPRHRPDAVRAPRTPKSSCRPATPRWCWSPRAPSATRSLELIRTALAALGG